MSKKRLFSIKVSVNDKTSSECSNFLSTNEREVREFELTLRRHFMGVHTRVNELLEMIRYSVAQYDQTPTVIQYSVSINNGKLSVTVWRL